MINFNKINKLKILLFSLCTLLSVSLFAQSEKTTEQSTIVMTEAELDSFLSTIAEARRSQLQERESKRLKEDLAELRLKYKEQSEMETRGYASNDISNQQILRELRYLNQRIDNLRGNNLLPSMMGGGGRDNSTIIMPSGASTAPAYPQNGRSTTTFIPNKKSEGNINDDKINELQKKIDSLRIAGVEAPSQVGVDTLKDSLDGSNPVLKDLRRQMDSLALRMQNVDNVVKPEKKSETTPYYQQQVFFDNNSEQLRANYFAYIQDLTQILVANPEAKVLLEGWASPLGNTTYNKQLSMRRAESVERAFINNGIDASRIMTSFRGEDKSSSEAQARRVDMSIVSR